MVYIKKINKKSYNIMVSDVKYLCQSNIFYIFIVMFVDYYGLILSQKIIQFKNNMHYDHI